jgi:hypothetical protein
MRSLRAIPVALALGLLTACSVLSIHHKNNSVDGVPFFIRTAVCRHELVWLEPVFALTLQSVSVKDGKETVTPLGAAQMSLSDYTAPTTQQKLTTLKNAIVKGDDFDTWISNWTSLQAYAYNPLAKAEPDPGNIVLVSNVNKPEVTVDYRDLYYFNTHRPLIGTAKADVKLASDGTMTEGSGELESKTLQSFLDLLPIKQLVSAAAGISTKGGALPPIAYRLQIESHAIKHTHYRYAPVDTDDKKTQCSPLPAVAFGDPAYNREREDAGAEKPANKDDKNTVKVNGEIKLPQKDEKK